MSNDSSYDDVRAQLKSKIGKGADKDEVVWSVVDAVATVIDDVKDSSVGTFVKGANMIYNKLKPKKDPIVPNPWFVWNGHDDADNKYTRRYLKHRGWKKNAGSVFSFGGSAASDITQIDVAGALMHGQATALSSAHIMQLRTIAKGHRQSRTISEWLDLLVKLKAIKAGIRGTQLAGAVIPIGVVGNVTGVAAKIGKIGVKLTYTKACLVTSADIHWRAYQEQAISRGRFGAGGKIGPASRIVHEIFTKRGATRIFGKYDVDQIIKEPSGWVALNDKLMLM